ncbi:type II toxin-antitoxin system VapC family toxin [Pseudomonadota bacterium]|jgi:PIN domain nuclease of toxin-antitoxin system
MGSSRSTLLDTHVLVWLDEASPRLGKSAIAKIDRAFHSGVAMISAISFWEVGMLVRKGRIRLDVDLAVWRKDFLEQGLIEVPVTGDIGIQASCFDDFHGDPADRLIAATALQNTAVLVTADERLLACELAITRLDARI